MNLQSAITRATRAPYTLYESQEGSTKTYLWGALLLGATVLGSGLLSYGLQAKKIELPFSFLEKPSGWGSLMGVGAALSLPSGLIILAAKTHTIARIGTAEEVEALLDAMRNGTAKYN